MSFTSENGQNNMPADGGTPAGAGLHPELVRGGQTQPVFNYADSILERVYVETPVDTDGDGKLDLIAVYIRRPKETLGCVKVPAVYVANPYMLHCNEDWYVPHSVNEELKVCEEQNLSEEDAAYDFTKDVSAVPRFPRETKGFASSLEETQLTEDPDFEAICDAYGYFVCRGYAAVFCGGLGTAGSDGFTITGSREEILAFRSVIDWLCGRARAFTNREDNIEVKAGWCTGKVAMTGKSYLGTLCIGVAMTGVPGLETIIPEAAISNWYQYYRNNGLVVPALEWQGDDLDILAKYCFSRALCEEDYAGVKEDYGRLLAALLTDEDRDSGNYNRFWDERNYLKLISGMKASALIIHGINDWNVKMNQCIPFWNAMKAQGIPAKMLLHQGDHIYIYNMKGSPALEAVHSWLDYHLYGLENGVMDRLPNVCVQSNLDQLTWLTSADFPPAECGKAEFPIGPETKIKRSSCISANAQPDSSAGAPVRSGGRSDNSLADSAFADDLSAAGFDREKDNQKEWLEHTVLPENEGHSWCLKYTWNPFAEGQPGEGRETLRISGEVSVSFTCSLNRETAILSAMLVEYGEASRMTVSQLPSGAGKRSYGPGAPDFEEMVFGNEEQPSLFRVISRGQMNAQNREAIWKKSAVVPGQAYEYRFSMVPTDYTVAAGRRLGLILYGSDPEQTLRPMTVTEVTVDEDSISVQIPFV